MPGEPKPEARRANPEILASATGRGESTRSGTGLLGAGGSSSGLGGAGLDMSSSNFANTILGEAVHSAVSSTIRHPVPVTIERVS